VPNRGIHILKNGKNTYHHSKTSGLIESRGGGEVPVLAGSVENRKKGKRRASAIMPFLPKHFGKFKEKGSGSTREEHSFLGKGWKKTIPTPSEGGGLGKTLLGGGQPNDMMTWNDNEININLANVIKGRCTAKGHDRARIGQDKLGEYESGP